MVTELPTTFPCLVKAIYSWSGEEKRDLGFVEGDVIEVLNTGDGNWWMGKLKRNKMIGLFPCNFVEFIPNKSKPASSDIVSSNSKERPKSVMEPSSKDQKQINHRRSTAFQELDSRTHDVDQRKYATIGKYSTQPFITKPRDEFLGEIANVLNESDVNYKQSHSEPWLDRESEIFTTGHDQYYDYDHNDYYYDDNYDLEDTGPPPLPPPHGIKHSPATPPKQYNQFPNLDRTPSPLRHAMDDVLESLEHMHDISRSNSTSLTAVDSNSSGQQTANTAINAVYSRKRDSSATLTVGSNETLNDDTYQQKYYALTNNNNKHGITQVEEDEDEHQYMPFDPNSYDALADTSYDSQAFSRTDTYRSISSINTNSLSTVSNSTTPTTVSDISATSAGSLARRRQENLLRAQVSASPISSPSVKHTFGDNYSITEVPVDLPSNSKTSGDSKSVRSLKLKRSAGFLKRLFTGSKDESENQQLSRTRSRSSRLSSKSTTSLKDKVKSVSSKAFALSPSISDSGKPFGKSSSNWIEIRRDVHRANSITNVEHGQRRKKRELEGLLVTEPTKALEQIQGNQTTNGITRGDGRLDPRLQDFSHVDQVILSMNSWPQIMTFSVFATSRIGRQFEYDIDRLRAIFEFCASKLVWEQPGVSSDDDDDEEEEGIASFALSRLMKTRRATPKEVSLCVKTMCDALEIPCQVVEGHVKLSGEIWDRTGISPVDHYWNAVLINNDEWRFIDASLASPSFPIRRDSYETNNAKKKVNDFQFIATPAEFIYTHVPANENQQFLVPPLSTENALSLPLAGPSVFTNNLRLINYHTGLTRLENFEVAELDITVPHGVEMIAAVDIRNLKDDAPTSSFEECKFPGLAQPFWKDNKRYYRVKAVVPESYSQGTLNIYIGDRQQQTVNNINNVSLAYSIGITHSGQNAPFEFVTRHCTPHCKRQDIYVIQPQCKKLVGGNNYTFSINQHPSTGLTSGSGFSRTKLAIQSPSGKITKLSKKKNASDNQAGLICGTWESSVKCLEVGTWRGLVLADNGNAWSVFAEWYCV